MSRILVKNRFTTLPIDCPYVEFDMSYICEMLDRVPEIQAITNRDAARVLAAQFLAAGDHCDELVAVSWRYKAKLDVTKRAEKGAAAWGRSGPAGAKTAKDKEQYAEQDTIYVQAHNDSVEAEAVFRRIESMHGSLQRSFQLCKDISNNTSLAQHAQSAGFNDRDAGLDSDSHPVGSKKTYSKNGWA